MNDIISIGNLWGSFQRAFRRFPATVILLIGSVIWGVAATHDVFGDQTTVSVGYFLGTSWIFSLAIGLWSEAFGVRTRTMRLLQTAALTMVAADAVWLYCNALGAEYSDGYAIARMSVLAALTVGAVFVPVRGGEEGQWWFSARQIANLLGAAGIAAVITIALIIILSTVQALFGCDAWQWFPTLCIVFASGLPALVFLSNIPSTDNTQARRLSGFFNGLVKYILLPLTLVYMAILYVYGGRILLAWELPRGGVAWPVMWSVFCVVLFLYAIRPFAALETSALLHRTVRRLPMAMLPLLVLLAVAIGYRVRQYGVTTERLYVVTFTLWSFAAMLYWGLSRSRRIVPAVWSLAAIFVTVSVIPGVNFYAWGSRVESRTVPAVQETPDKVADWTAQVTADNVAGETAKEIADKVADGTAQVTADKVADEILKVTPDKVAGETAKETADELVADLLTIYSFKAESVAIPRGAVEVTIERISTIATPIDADGCVRFRLPSYPCEATIDVQHLLSDSTAAPEVRLTPPTSTARVRRLTLHRSPSDTTKILVTGELLLFK